MTFLSNRKTEIVYKLDDPDYRADKALSTSELKKMRESPKAFWSYRNKIYPYTSTPAMEKGTLFHMYALEPDRFANEVITCPEEYNNKRKKVSQDWWKEQEALGKKVIKESDLQAIRSMFGAYSELSVVREVQLMKPQTEVSVFAKKFVKNIDAKCRVDILCGDTVIDIKTTMKGGAKPSKFLWRQRDLGYDWQQVHYSKILQKAGVEVKRWIFAVIETEPPYESSEIILAEADLAEARKEVDEAYKKLLSCMRVDSWPSHTPTKPVEISRFNTADRAA